MDITIHTDHGVSTLHLHIDSGSANQKIDLLTARVSALEAQVLQMTADEQTALDSVNAKIVALVAKDDAMTAALQTNTSVLQGLSAEIAALKQQATDPQVVAGLTAIGEKLDTHIAAVTAQVAQLQGDDAANAPT